MCGALKLFIARAIDCAMAARQPVVAVPPRAGCIAAKAVAVDRAGMARIAGRFGPCCRLKRQLLLCGLYAAAQWRGLRLRAWRVPAAGLHAG